MKVLASGASSYHWIHPDDFFSSLTRGPQALVREIIRQQKRNLWICAEFTLHDSTLLVGARCADRIDVGFLGYGNYIGRPAG
ncbi:MAG: hypothetical protein V3U33_07215 [candidate division NC10 bacterium]